MSFWKNRETNEFSLDEFIVIVGTVTIYFVDLKKLFFVTRCYLLTHDDTFRIYALK